MAISLIGRRMGTLELDASPLGSHHISASDGTLIDQRSQENAMQLTHEVQLIDLGDAAEQTRQGGGPWLDGPPVLPSPPPF